MRGRERLGGWEEGRAETVRQKEAQSSKKRAKGQGAKGLGSSKTKGESSKEKEKRGAWKQKRYLIERMPISI
jgi:hypothetical protein